ncbi:C4-dicarboxylate ABC transporter, partial [Streptomyces sp. NPDC006356]
FPVGTCVTGAETLARHTGLVVYDGLAIGLYGVLVAAWTVAAARTTQGLLNGTLLAPPRTAPATPRPATGRPTPAAVH